MRGFGGAKTCPFALYKRLELSQFSFRNVLDCFTSKVNQETQKAEKVFANAPFSLMIGRVLHTVHLPLTLLVYFISVHSPFYSLLRTDGIITNQELG